MIAPDIALLNAVDWVVDDLSATAADLAALLRGLKVTGELHLPEHGFDTVFYRSPLSMGLLPTRVQLVALSEPVIPEGQTCWVAPFDPMQREQGRSRLQRVHGTVLAVRNFKQTAAWLDAKKAPYYLEHPCEHLPYPRIWLGWGEGGLKREPDVDGGLFLEFIPLEVFPSIVRDADPDAPGARDSPVRVAARTVLVPDLEATVAQLTQVLGREPSGRVCDDVLGIDGARYAFGHVGSAQLVVAQARPGTPAGRYFADQGPGTYLTTFAVTDPGGVLASAVAAGFTPDAERGLAVHDKTGIQIQIAGVGA
ncbi:VOC family protein [Mycobacterium marseillense]|uniref:VOC family protein n=1 Tax=Mycobacterium marseillense TaxID=701042 RepID=UPI0011A44079|nr:VOC family protein [Mycobacterium marseillense]